MKKSDLKSGMWVELRNGNRYLIMTNVDTLYHGNNRIVGIRDGGFQVFSKYSDDLLSGLLNSYDVMKVFFNGGITGSTYSFKNMPILWERKEHTELSISEIEEKLSLPSGTLRIKKDS